MQHMIFNCISCCKERYGGHLKGGWGLDGSNVITVNVLILMVATGLCRRVSLLVGKSGVVGIRLATYSQIIHEKEVICIILAGFL